MGSESTTPTPTIPIILANGELISTSRINGNYAGGCTMSISERRSINVLQTDSGILGIRTPTRTCYSSGLAVGSVTKVRFQDVCVCVCVCVCFDLFTDSAQAFSRLGASTTGTARMAAGTGIPLGLIRDESGRIAASEVSTLAALTMLVVPLDSKYTRTCVRTAMEAMKIGL
jgi:hypothetical protein